MEPVEADWYDDESWADLELATAGTVRGLYPNDPQWVRRWTCYAELMDAAVRHTGQDDEIYDEVADYHLRIYHELLDPGLFSMSRASMGKTILGLLKQVIERLTQDDGPLGDSIADAGTRAYSREVILAWHYALEYHGNWKAAARHWYLAAKPQRVKPESAARVMQDRIWRHGLARPQTYPANSAAALRLMTRAFDDALRQYMYTGAGDDADVLDQLLPACFAERIRGDVEHLKEKRRQYSPEEQRTLGIDENGYTTLMADALPKLRGCIAHKESMLVLGPTSSGKSRIGRIAVCHAITRAHRSHGRAIVLLPTKALVNQAVDEWRDFVKGTYAEQWHILAGSRDYPQNDEAIARREFEIAVMIPEKLAGLMAGGMTLDGIDIVIVDELQNLAEEERGPRLEMLLTTIRANYQIPLIGLSATLSPQAIEDVAAWLGIDGKSIVTTRMRPVPLDYIVCDDSQAMVRSADGAEASRNLDLRSMLRAWRDDADLGSRMESGQIKTYRRALALAATLLRGDGGMDGGSRVRSVLCFVGSREDAQRMADIAQTVLDRDPRTPHVDPEANPFKGRFSDLSDDEARRRYRDFQRYPQTRLRNSVAKSLRTGVGYHTARLDPEMRVEMEEAFRIGLVRLLFATDNTPKQAALIMRRYGLQAAEDPEDGLITLTSVLRPELSVRMMVCTSIVTMRDLDAARGYADVILACAGATGGVQSAELSPKGGNPVVLQPSILLQAADSVNRIVGPVGSGDGPDMPLASDYEYVPADEEAHVDDEAADAESDDVWEPELDDWDEPGSAPAGPQSGFELVGHRLLQLLVAAPPILARNELNRLIAGMTVAAPPALHDDLMVCPDDSDPADLPGEATNEEMP